MEIRIYVGNLPKTTTQEELTAMFAKAGAVSGAEVVMDKGTGLSKGFAFVTMANQEEANKAITMFNAYKLGENELKVNIAKPRPETVKA
ncbi:MAG: RNA-binding protein [Anaerolineales bacterium]|nr:RNA-binding protein [Anaerolineales bacterium]